ncbi:SWIM zinc finger family protein [Catellatospora paridis]|uniref:SWIM zinc finger family protein n=1 Tax=Catellatospora paridis TaxID=1617086 RepID=UPI0012D39909|nr:SWIM zinc finger family protein [Catellatospora paridis]
MSGLPAVTAPALAETLDALPGRLRKKVDDAVTRAAAWPVSTADGQVTVTVDESTAVTLVLTDGVVRTGADARCSCLLAPNCLHRVAVLAMAPVHDGLDDEPTHDPRAASGEAGTGPHGADPGSTVDGVPATEADDAEPPSSLTARQRGAAEGLWCAGAAVLDAGTSGSGLVLRTALLRAVHEARANGLHRAAAAGTRVAAGLQAMREAQPQFRLAELTDDLRDLLTVSHRLRDPALPGGLVAELLGVSRRGYDPQAGLRLYGLCTVPVVAESGYAGTATYVVDRDGRLWTVTDVAPGGADRAARSGDTVVALGEAGLTHRELTRAGMIVSGGTASSSGRLGAGRAVRAVRASGAGWADEPLRGLWEQPLEEQVSRAFAALAEPAGDRPAGTDLMFLTVRVRGAAAGDAVLAETAGGAAVLLTVADDHPELAYRDNMRLLGAAAGLELLVVGRPDPARRATVAALSIGLAPGTGDGLRLPESWSGHADLGFDRLHRSQLRAGDGTASTARPPATGDPALQLLRRHVERMVAGGRAVHAVADTQERSLRRARLDLGAHLLASVTAAARHRPRNVFGRVTADDGEDFARAWLAAAVYERAATQALIETSWLA